MRVHLDYPFNARFSRFIEIVNMTGADFVRLSEKDLGRLCDGEGPHLYDLTNFQQSLRPPVSPHVRDIFSLPPSPKLPQKPPDLCDPVSDLEFDFSEEQNVSTFDNTTSECSKPSCPIFPDQSPSDAMTDDDASDDESLASLPVQSLPLFTVVSSNLDAKPHDAESLIDLFSPLPPLPLSELDDSDSSDGTLSPDSRRMIHDVFDSPHLSTLSPLASPYHSDVENEVDLIGLGLPSNEATAAKPGEISIYSPIFSDVDFVDGHEALDAHDHPAVQETPRLIPTLPNDPPPLDIGQSFSPEHPQVAIDPCPPEVQFEVWAHCPDGGTYIPAEENPTRLPTAVDLENVLDPYPPVNFPSPEKWQKSLPRGEFHLSTSPPPLSEDHEFDPAYEFHANLDGESPESGGAGLSAFMSDLRSLDSSPPLSPHFDTPYTLSQVFSDRQILSGGSLGLSVSPELTIIETPVTSAYGDDVLIASPSTTYHAHGPYHFDSEQVVLKHLAVGGKDSTLPVPPSPPAARESAPVRRPKIEVIIPSLPSLLEDEQLSSLMSSIELAKFKSRNGSRSSLVEPSSGPPWLTTGGLSSQDRSIWPLSSSAERFLPSPYMKDPDAMGNRSPTTHRRRRGEEAPPPSAIGSAPGLQRTKSLGTVSEDLTEALAEFTSSEDTDASSSKDVAAQTHQQQASGSTGWCKVGDYIRTMISPVGADLASEEDCAYAGDANDGAPVPGGWAL
ncbi:hypothetical protein H1R20_g10129, partial [Candolleomyces eurysporus]